MDLAGITSTWTCSSLTPQEIFLLMIQRVPYNWDVKAQSWPCLPKINGPVLRIPLSLSQSKFYGDEALLTKLSEKLDEAGSYSIQK